MSKKLKSKSPLDAAACSGFFIVNTTDRPSEELLAERRADGKFYYLHPQVRHLKEYWGMAPTDPTPVEAFGLLVDVKAGILVGAVDDSATVGATYADGRPRRWQGSRVFSFRIQNAKGEARADSAAPHPSTTL